MRKSKIHILYIFLLVIIVPASGHGWVWLSGSGTWNIAVSSINLAPGGAGANLQSSFESLPAAGTLSSWATGNWRLEVSRSAGNWPQDVPVFVQTNSSVPSGGELTVVPGYMEITDTPVTIITGQKKGGRLLWYASFEFQYLIDGLSVDAGAGSFQTTVIFTITEQ